MKQLTIEDIQYNEANAVDPNKLLKVLNEMRAAISPAPERKAKRVRIIRCSDTAVWYRDDIGKEYEVAREDEADYFVFGGGFGVLKQDAEVIEFREDE